MNAQMNTERTLFFLFLLFCSARTQSDRCQWISSQYGAISREALTLLRNMGGQFAITTGPFPHKLYARIEDSKVGDQVKFLAEATEQIVKIFNADTKTANWDTQSLDNFLNILNTRQLDRLRLCATAYPDTRGRSPRLRRHFRKLKKSLRKTDYSRESWEQIRTVVQTHLQRMDMIAGEIKRKLRD